MKLQLKSLGMQRLVAVVNGVAGMREGYSDTTCRFYKSFVDAYKRCDDVELEYKGQGYEVFSKTQTEMVFVKPDDEDDVMRVTMCVTAPIDVNSKTIEWFAFNQMFGLPEDIEDGDLPWDNGAAVSRRNRTAKSVLLSFIRNMPLETINDVSELENVVHDMHHCYNVMNDYVESPIHFFPIHVNSNY